MWSAGTMPELPIHEIDLAPFRTGDAADRASVADAFDRAGRDSGFILLTGHGVDPAVIDDTFDAWQAFFDLPLEEKVRAVAPPEADGLIGYTAYGAQALAYTAGGESPPDLMEAFSIGREDTTDAFFDDFRDWFPPNVWPDAPPSLRAAVGALEDSPPRRRRRGAARHGAGARSPRGVAGGTGRARRRHHPLQPLPARSRVRTPARPTRTRWPHRLRHGHAARRRPGARVTGAARRRVARRGPAAWLDRVQPRRHARDVDQRPLGVHHAPRTAARAGRRRGAPSFDRPLPRR